MYALFAKKKKKEERKKKEKNLVSAFQRKKT